MNLQKTLIAALAASTLTFGMGAAYAGGPECADGGFHDGGKQHGRWNDEDRNERHAARQEKLYKALKLSATQETAWKAFTAEDAPQWRQGQQPDRKAFAQLSTPERMEKMLEFSQKHQEFMAQRLAALKIFYAQLTDEQKKTFDSFHRGGDKNHPRGDRKRPRDNKKSRQ
ncbi:MAG: Spy/CpxP family protein refolding chaperone [Zoogloeaceae bacterium]|nr:Spy/CpxP family protein refolding chaperone [Zoogloeaceae bacterium]